MPLNPSSHEAPPAGAPAVAIAGCGAFTAVGRGVPALRTAMLTNASGLRPCARFAAPRFQSSIVGAALLHDPAVSLATGDAGTSPSPPADGGEGRGEEVQLSGGPDPDNPAWTLATAALHEARDQAHEILAPIPAARIGLVLATTKANIAALEQLAEQRPCSAPARRHLQGELLAADLAAAHGAGGPVQCVSVACASGLVALQQGAKWLQRGAADAVLVVGVDALSAFVMAGFTALKAIDPAGCRPFDRDRRGLSPGEAGAAIVLVRAELALAPARPWERRRLAGEFPPATQPPAGETPARPGLLTLRGWGGSNDANHLTGPSRDGSGLALAIRRALDAARLQPEQIDYINAHGTGTPYNDAMESLALRAVFGERPPPVSAAKGMLGHTLGAAGVVETILCVLAMQERCLPGTPRLIVPAEGAPPSLVMEPRPIARLDCVLKLNTGFGGINGALILGHA